MRFFNIFRHVHRLFQTECACKFLLDGNILRGIYTNTYQVFYAGTVTETSSPSSVFHLRRVKIRVIVLQYCPDVTAMIEHFNVM